uniref:Uncharacterized protein n=1 Tax=Piliocolobus tephrosceles TaxID=591936 RepID=A0A8C9HWW6_9PRIM
MPVIPALWENKAGGSLESWSLQSAYITLGDPEYESDNSCKVLQATECVRRHRWWNRVFGPSWEPVVEKYLVATQIVTVGVTDWCAGSVFQKVGKHSNCSRKWLSSLQIASHSGYVQINWKRVEKDVNKATQQVKKRKYANKATPKINNIIEEVTEFIKQNIMIPS